MWRVDEVEDGWQLTRDGQPCGAPHKTYGAGLLALADEARAEALAADQADALGGALDGLLPEAWSSTDGIAFSEPTGDGRDFSECSWSWRSPDQSLLPLMFQDVTDMGHFGAKLAGFIESLDQNGGTIYAAGRFYDSDQGKAARDLLLGGRRFGVSVDPGSVDAAWECLEEDEEGWCVAERVVFTAYEVAGLTMTPFPAFERAAIQLAPGAQLAVAEQGHAFTDDNDDGNCDACISEDEDGVCTEQCGLSEAEHEAEDGDAEASRLPALPALAAAAPVTPPLTWFHTVEPDVGDRSLIDQGQGRVACPLTITDDGRVFGHLAAWGQCHVGYPGACVEPPASPAAYRHFHVGSTKVAAEDGTTAQVATGTLCVSADHAPLTQNARAAADHYAHTGLAWADVRVTDGIHGPWVAGALRPGLSPELVRVLRGSSLSGDWRKLGGGMELVAVLAVNTPGFPIHRDALAAAGLTAGLPTENARARVVAGEPVALVAAGTVRRCADCARKSKAARDRRETLGAAPSFSLAELRSAIADAVAPLSGRLDVIEARTRHLRRGEADALRSRVSNHR